MKVNDAGHSYYLNGHQVLRFLKKTRNTVTNELQTVYDGTTNEEVIEVLIDRITFLNNALPCQENATALYHLNQALEVLNLRTKKRVTQKVEGTDSNHDTFIHKGQGI